MADFLIGLTGGVASGKSTVERAFAALGVAIADADLIARDIVEPGQPALLSVVERFGAQMLDADGRLDRAAMRQRVFADPVERKALEAILHPRIRQGLRQACQSATGAYAIATIPLLTEGGGRSAYPWLDRILVVDVPVATQLARLMQRDEVDQPLAERMLAAQASRDQRLALADDIIVNDGSLEELPALVADLDRLYRQLAGAAPGAEVMPPR
ncbi:dephospho-CoA kinase [Pseudoxanthomonas dokdonensis]|uniref:Dephospho-CoA kinase n=1 Tax=Pseudoxanthomonas dokdonensis TaxID=344882 RepID=A0A0R0CWS0_9GAMM|nr:dephospho-CoA kinase [Pseudoxanthomonas dokdonensis]KRG70180.1 dephospho-CoA kinase [Pseudoxanthomonas dokdonensis]